MPQIHGNLSQHLEGAVRKCCLSGGDGQTYEDGEWKDGLLGSSQYLHDHRSEDSR